MSRRLPSPAARRRSHYWALRLVCDDRGEGKKEGDERIRVEAASGGIGVGVEFLAVRESPVKKEEGKSPPVVVVEGGGKRERDHRCMAVSPIGFARRINNREVQVSMVKSSDRRFGTPTSTDSQLGTNPNSLSTIIITYANTTIIYY